MRAARVLSIAAVWFLLSSCDNDTTGPEPSPNPQPENVWKMAYSDDVQAIGLGLGGFWFNGPKDGWAVCGTMIVRWDGSSWRKWADLKEAFSTVEGICNICALSEDCVWLVTFFPKGSFEREYYLVHYDGSQWRRFEMMGEPELYAGVSDIYFLAPDDGWVYSSDGFYHYDGVDWTRAYEPVDTASGNFAFASPDLGWAVAPVPHGYGLIEWDGSTWTPLNVPPVETSENMRHVWARGPDNAWATGLDPTGKEHGLLYHFDGSSWGKVPIKGMPYLYCAFSGASNGWLVSEYWAWLYRNNRLTCYAFTDSPRAYSVRDVWALGRDDAWIYAYRYAGGTGEVALFHFEGLP